jgi:hypothetical protein
MWFALIIGIVAGWVVLAAAVALVVGRAVRLADRRRPRPRPHARATSALGRAVQLATGQIPVIHARTLKAVTGAIPLIRARSH